MALIINHAAPTESQFEWLTGYQLAQELHEDDPGQPYVTARSLVLDELERLGEPELTFSETGGMYDFYASIPWEYPPPF